MSIPFTKCYRVEFSDGYGLFFKNLFKNNVRLDKRPFYAEKDFPELHKRHLENFKFPKDENLDVNFERREWFCAFNDLKSLLYWIHKEEMVKMISLGFKVYEITCSDFQIGKLQTLFTKEFIIEKKDMTNEILSNY